MKSLQFTLILIGFTIGTAFAAEISPQMKAQKLSQHTMELKQLISSNDPVVNFDQKVLLSYHYPAPKLRSVDPVEVATQSLAKVMKKHGGKHAQTVISTMRAIELVTFPLTITKPDLVDMVKTSILNKSEI